MPPSCGFDTMGHFVCIKVCNPEPGRDGITQSQYAHPRKNFPAQAIWLQAVPPSLPDAKPPGLIMPRTTLCHYLFCPRLSLLQEMRDGIKINHPLLNTAADPLCLIAVERLPAVINMDSPTLKCDKLVNNYLYL